ncbi:MAG: tRNA uridine-5-carboxymethylaminomethyl(34) synthesis GTPase MnmE [Tidjanibacter sp.]|nr:tRNA uridine-5-carboxymethylaminomethyl(34) synthesis GTPase MnmE [Tidjanibacter sp.]
MHLNDTIVAAATPTGGAIAIVRIEGPEALAVCDKLFRADRGTLASQAKGYTLMHGNICDGTRRIDDVLVTVFRAPHSYTGGDMVEISCHGSAYIVGEIIRLVIEAGARSATAGEFTMRAFIGGKMDLSQAEAVADVIAADSKVALTMADTQMRGNYSAALATLRGELLTLASLLELELDFGEEEVEFADRTQLTTLLHRIESEVKRLADSFAVGNAVKRGIAVAIVGEPNVGKSTLLNRLIGEERAMVSDIAGTTRDTIEECLTIDGVTFRFIDTAGVHQTDDQLENMGIERTRKAIAEAQIVVVMSENGHDNILTDITEGQKVVRVVNKIDLCDGADVPEGWIGVSAKMGIGIDELVTALRQSVDTSQIMSGGTVVSNSRHYEALLRAGEALRRADEGLQMGLSTDLVAQDIRQVLDHIGAITGEVTNNEILGQIFSKFCIGK